jgi:transcription-repair coupling factor (superfamily II helicase)
VLTEVAEKRLQSIKEFTELGSGFKIAMRDLSIRGAGNLLGAEQHGFIASVGFDMYSQMLADEIAKRKAEMSGEEIKEVKPVSTLIDVSIDAYLPSDYIYDSIQKIEIYKKVAAIRTFEEADDVIDELVDRFGDLPQAVSNLLAVARLKVYGSLYGIEQISGKGDELLLRFAAAEKRRIDRKKVDQLCLKHENRFKQSSDQEPNPSILLRGKGLNMEQKIHMIEQFLQAYKDVLLYTNELQNVTP